MAKVDASLFIDANQYLKLYMAYKGKKKLLGILSENQQYIFVTAQIVDEVQRNKLRVAERFIGAITQGIRDQELPTFDSPEHFFGRSDPIAVGLHEKLKQIQKQTREVESDLQKAAFQVLQQISLSEDDVSKTLAEIFKKAVVHTPEEFQRAKDRKQRGNPPGKPADPLGDQLSWEQLLSHCKSKMRIWIVSEDSDYSIKYHGKRLLNSFLQQDIKRGRHPSPEAFCFDNVLSAIEDFESKTGVKRVTTLTKDESREIKEELDSLLPFGFGGPEHGVRGFGEGYWASDLMRRFQELPEEQLKMILDDLPGYKLKRMFDELPPEKLNAILDDLPGSKLKKIFDELPENKLKKFLPTK
jgi:hypothetical protein